MTGAEHSAWHSVSLYLVHAVIIKSKAAHGGWPYGGGPVTNSPPLTAALICWMVSLQFGELTEVPGQGPRWAKTKNLKIILHFPLSSYI